VPSPAAILFSSLITWLPRLSTSTESASSTDALTRSTSCCILIVRPPATAGAVMTARFVRTTASAVRLRGTRIRRLSLLKINPSTYAVLIINQPRSPSTAGADASR
jgi:hypothetical protein